jgi:WD40 repeat protein
MIITCSNDNTVKVWEYDTENLISTLYGHDDWVLFY